MATDPKNQATFSGVIRQMFSPLNYGSNLVNDYVESRGLRGPTYESRVGLENPTEMFYRFSPQITADRHGGIADIDIMGQRPVGPFDYPVDQRGNPLSPEDIAWREEQLAQNALDADTQMTLSELEGGYGGQTLATDQELEDMMNPMTLDRPGITMADDNVGQMIAGQSLASGGMSAALPEPEPTWIDRLSQMGSHLGQFIPTQGLGDKLIGMGDVLKQTSFGRDFDPNIAQQGQQSQVLRQRKQIEEDTLAQRKAIADKEYQLGVAKLTSDRQNALLEAQAELAKAGAELGIDIAKSKSPVEFSGAIAPLGPAQRRYAVNAKQTAVRQEVAEFISNKTQNLGSVIELLSTIPEGGAASSEQEKQLQKLLPAAGLSADAVSNVIANPTFGLNRLVPLQEAITRTVNTYTSSFNGMGTSSLNLQNVVKSINNLLDDPYSDKIDAAGDLISSLQS
jgi:hypothetical protein